MDDVNRRRPLRLINSNSLACTWIFTSYKTPKSCCTSLCSIPSLRASLSHILITLIWRKGNNERKAHSTLSVVANLFDLFVPFFVSVSDAVKTLISANVSDGNKPALMYICCILQQSIGIYKYGLPFNHFLKVSSSKTSLSHDITWGWFAQILNKNCPD